MFVPNKLSAVGTKVVLNSEKEIDSDTIKVSHFEHTVSGYDKYGLVTCKPFNRYCTLYKRGRETALRGKIEKWHVKRTANFSYEEKVTTYRGHGYYIVVTVKNTVRYEAR